MPFLCRAEFLHGLLRGVEMQNDPSWYSGQNLLIPSSCSEVSDTHSCPEGLSGTFTGF